MNFELFDPDEPVNVTFRRLPHWYQPGVTYFITFRTIDSMPPEVLDRWRADRIAWLRHHGIASNTDDWQAAVHLLPAGEQREFHRHFSAAYHEALDRGCGECVLRRPELARIVADSLLRFDGTRYFMGDFVVMPNHVHLLVQLLGETTARGQSKSWKRFTAGQIHRVLARHGHFWQAESFDHLVRSPEQFAYLQRYIAENPSRAELCEGEYLLYQPR